MTSRDRITMVNQVHCCQLIVPGVFLMKYNIKTSAKAFTKIKSEKNRLVLSFRDENVINERVAVSANINKPY